MTGKQLYGAWTGALFPNCTTVDNFADGQGPNYHGIKIFNQPLPSSLDPAIYDRQLWTEDCASGCLFNVEEDPTEHFDLSKDPNQAHRLQAMQGALMELNKGLFEPERGDMQLAACLNAIDIGGFYGPFHATEGWYSPVAAPAASQRIKDLALLPVLRVVNRPGVQNFIVETLRPWAPKILPLAVHDQCLDHGSPAFNQNSSGSPLIDSAASEVQSFMGSVAGDQVMLV